MNSFETDMKRALISRRFFFGILIQSGILLYAGPKSELFRMSVPVLCTLPYTDAWLTDYESRYLGFCLLRAGRLPYVCGKIFSCAISGGSVLMSAGVIYQIVPAEEKTEIYLPLFFMSGVLWALVSAFLAAWSRSRYLAYGGGFVIYYLFIILHERYFKDWYCLNTFEWLMPEHLWLFGERGILLLVGMILWIPALLYMIILWRCVECL